jgi:hypothetical protein
MSGTAKRAGFAVVAVLAVVVTGGVVPAVQCHVGDEYNDKEGQLSLSLKPSWELVNPRRS